MPRSLNLPLRAPPGPSYRTFEPRVELLTRARLRKALEVEFAQAVLDPFPDSEEVDTGAAGATAPAA
jgi:hypothetical protein